jgi:hypothetical protein
VQPPRPAQHGPDSSQHLSGTSPPAW